MGWGVMNDFIENKRVIGGYGVERKSLLDIKEGLIETILLLSSWYNSHFLYNPAHTIPRVLLVFVGLYRSFPPSLILLLRNHEYYMVQYFQPPFNRSFIQDNPFFYIL